MRCSIAAGQRTADVLLPEPPVEGDGFEKAATSAAGPPAKRPLRETEELGFVRFKRGDLAGTR
jgi:hypothetical protein